MKRPGPVLAPPEGRPSAAPGTSTVPGSWLRERIWLLDPLVAAGVFLYNLPIIPIHTDRPAAVVGLVATSSVICGAHLLRRRHPHAVLGIMLTAACVQLVFGAPLLVADVMLLFAVYNLATRSLWWVSLTGAVSTVVWLLVAAVPHLGDEVIDIGQLGVLIVVTFWVWTWGTLVRIRRQYVAGLRERAEQAERERETQARIAAAEERARIAREIHDIVSHSLSVVVLMSDGAAAKVDSEPERAKSAMLSVRDTGRTALAEMRRMLGVLRDDEPGSHAPQPGIGRLDALVEESRTAGLPVRLTVQGEPALLPAGVGLTVYRIVQEALTNVRRHAGPNVERVEVSLRCRSQEVEVCIADDGQGSVQGPGTDAGGHGLVGMRERVAAHDGAFHAGPRPGGGFEVVAVLPLSGES